AVEHFRNACAADPAHAVAGLNLAEALVAAGEADQAREQAQRVLRLLDWQRGRNAGRDAAHFPPAFDPLRVGGGRAAAAHAGDPAGEARGKGELIRWRAHALLAGLTGELAHAHEAVLARPDLPPARASLGEALLRAGRPDESARHLRLALGGNPF